MKATATKAEITINDICDKEVKYKTINKEIEELWTGMDNMDNPLK